MSPAETPINAERGRRRGFKGQGRGGATRTAAGVQEHTADSHRRSRRLHATGLLSRPGPFGGSDRGRDDCEHPQGLWCDRQGAESEPGGTFSRHAQGHLRTQGPFWQRWQGGDCREHPERRRDERWRPHRFAVCARLHIFKKGAIWEADRSL